MNKFIITLAAALLWPATSFAQINVRRYDLETLRRVRARRHCKPVDQVESLVRAPA